MEQWEQVAYNVGMKIMVSGLLTNEFNEALLVADGQGAWGLPGGWAAGDVLPAVSLAAQVAAQTGILVIPVRLVGVYTTAVDTLTLLFRCLQKGGHLPQDGDNNDKQAAFYPLNQLPQPLAPHQARLLQDGGGHAGGAPLWDDLAATGSNPLQKLWQKWRGISDPADAPAWQLDVLVVTDNDSLLGPAGVAHNEAPWHTAVQLIPPTATLERITGLYVTPSQPPRLTLTFTAVGTNSPSPPTLPNTLLHRQALTDYHQDPHTTHFALIPAP